MNDGGSREGEERGKEGKPLVGWFEVSWFRVQGL